MPPDGGFLAALDNVQDAIQSLDRQGRVHEIRGSDERIVAIAKEYAKEPTNTVVVSPDNRSRTEINERIHAELEQLIQNKLYRFLSALRRHRA